MLGRAKSCRWQVFVRRRPPKQGELRTDVSKATMWGETGRRKSPRSGKGFNWLPQKCIFGALIRGLQNLESPFGKFLILFVRSRHCGELIRGLENLGTFPKGKRFYSFRLYEKNQKYPKGCGPLDSRGRFKSPLDTRFRRK